MFPHFKAKFCAETQFFQAWYFPGTSKSRIEPLAPALNMTSLISNRNHSLIPCRKRPGRLQYLQLATEVRATAAVSFRGAVRKLFDRTT
jgi:hypothetical protein